MEENYAAPVVLAMERYQDLLESEVIVQMIAQARDTLDEYVFERFVKVLFPKTPEVPKNECEG